MKYVVHVLRNAQNIKVPILEVFSRLTCAVCPSPGFSPSFRFSEEDSDVFSLLGLNGMSDSTCNPEDFLDDRESHSTAAIPVFERLRNFTTKATKNFAQVEGFCFGQVVLATLDR